MACWRAAGISYPLFMNPATTVEEKVLDLFNHFRCIDTANFSDQLPFRLLWQLWKEHNSLVYGRIQYRGSPLHDLPMLILKIFAWPIYPRWLRMEAGLNPPLYQETWVRPPENWIKCNYDGAFKTGTPAQAGWVFRDYNGVYLGAGQGRKAGPTTAMESEFQALLFAMQRAWSKSYQKMIFEGDCKAMVDILLDTYLNFSMLNWSREVKSWMERFEDTVIRWIPRENNKVANGLATHPLPTDEEFRFHYYVPSCVTSFLYVDYIASS